MNEMKKISVILMLLSLTACASRVQRTVYYDYRPPITHTSVHTTVHRYQPIEVTIYADRLYRGGFSTIQVVMVDGQYTEIPIRNKKGHFTNVFAHYYAGILHFDSDMNCHGIQGASRFNQDNGWHKGQMYTRVSAGKDYDLTGLRLMVRNVDQSKKLAVANNDGNRHEKDRNIHPEHANVDNKYQGQDQPTKSIQKQAVAGENIVVSQKNSINRDDGRVNNPSIESEKQVRATDRPPDYRSQTDNRVHQESDNEMRNERVAKLQKSVEEKVYSEKNKDSRNIKFSKNELNRTVAQKTADERKNASAKPDNPEKRGMTHVVKSDERNQSNEKEKDSVTEKKQVKKDRKDKKNKNDKDDNDEENSTDDELSKGDEKNSHATS